MNSLMNPIFILYVYAIRIKNLFLPKKERIATYPKLVLQYAPAIYSI